MVFFEKIYVHNDGDGVTVTPVFAETYGLLFGQQSGADAATEAPQGTANGFRHNAEAVNLARFFPLKTQNPAPKRKIAHHVSARPVCGDSPLVETRRVELLTS